MGIVDLGHESGPFSKTREVVDHFFCLSKFLDCGKELRIGLFELGCEDLVLGEDMAELVGGSHK